MKKALLTLAIVTVAALAAQAQNTIYTFNGGSALPTTNTAGITGNAFSGANANGTSAGAQFVISTTSASNNAGSSGTFNAAIAAKGGAFDPATSSYFEFTLTPGAGLAINASAFSLNERGTGTGPTVLTLRTSLDSFGSDAASLSIAADSAWHALGPQSISVAGAVDQAVTFRIYGSGGTGSSTTAANFRVDDVNVADSTTAVPEPATFAMVLGGVGMLVGAQRLLRRKK